MSRKSHLKSIFSFKNNVPIKHQSWYVFTHILIFTVNNIIDCRISDIFDLSHWKELVSNCGSERNTWTCSRSESERYMCRVRTEVYKVRPLLFWKPMPSKCYLNKLICFVGLRKYNKICTMINEFDHKPGILLTTSTKLVQ